MKAVRFSLIATQCGRPQSYMLWTKPGEDPEFQRALKQNRVMSIHQEARGGKKDFGIVGLTKDAHVTYFLFQKSLKRFAGHRVVGIDYDKLQQPKVPSARRAKQMRRQNYSRTNHASKSYPSSAPAIDSPAGPLKNNTTSGIIPSAPVIADNVARREPTKKASQASLVKAVSTALLELEEGKPVAACQRLKKALGRK